MPQLNQGTFDSYCKAHDLLEQARRHLYRFDVSRLNRKDVRVEALLERATDELYDIVEEIAYIKSQVTQLREIDRILSVNNNLHRADVIRRQDPAQLKHDCNLQNRVRSFPETPRALQSGLTLDRIVLDAITVRCERDGHE